MAHAAVHDRLSKTIVSYDQKLGHLAVFTVATACRVGFEH